MTPIGIKRAGYFALSFLILLGACQANPIIVQSPSLSSVEEIPDGMTLEEAASLESLKQVDDYPLYSMHYQGEAYQTASAKTFPLSTQGKKTWACSLFAVYGDLDDILMGRNFDWDFSPALLLYTDPADSYASISMVDLYYLGFGEEDAFGIAELSLTERENLINAPLIPFDGMNEAGLVIGMAAVPPGDMEFDPNKETVDSVGVIRMVLDHAATIDEAITIIRDVNIDMGGNYLHYLIAEKNGRSALVEFFKGEMIVHYNTNDWQAATNFLLSKVDGDPEAQCWRYNLISTTLKENQGKVGPRSAMRLLKDVAQEHTQWSIVYRVTAGEIWVAMGRNYDQTYLFNFD
jgi:hypothetical protein